MSEVFFHGTLCHVPLLEQVLGRPWDALDMVRAELRDFAVFEAKDQPFALLQATPGGTAAGVLARGLDDKDVARLEFYRAAFGFDRHPVTVHPEGGGATGAVAFSAGAHMWQAGAAWSQDQWQDRWGAICLRAATEMMAHFGHLSAQDVARRLPGIRIRAAAWVAAQARPGDGDHDLARDVVVHAHHRRYSNFFAAEEMDLQYRRYDGRLSPVLNRGAQMLGQAVVVLPYDVVRDAVLTVEQFRTPVFMGGDPAPWIIEPVSGGIDPGEDPQTAARRETMEEAGLKLSRLEKVGGLYASTGATSEFVHMFVGLANFSDRQSGGGLAEEGEDIRVGIVAYHDLIKGVDQGRYRDMPLVTTALWLARHRDRLRAAA